MGRKRIRPYPTSGVYKITNPEGAVYIGSSKDIYGRWHSHKTASIKKEQKIGVSLRKFGAINHKFEVLELCEIKQLKKREGFWQACSIGLGLECLNMCKAGNTVYLNGKRQKATQTKKNYYLDVRTGVYYDSIVEISKLYGINRLTLRDRVLSPRSSLGNRTQWIKV